MATAVHVPTSLSFGSVGHLPNVTYESLVANDLKPVTCLPYLQIPLLNIDEPGILKTSSLNLFFKPAKRPPEDLAAFSE